MTSAPPINLLPGESVLKHSVFTPYLIRAHLKTTMILTDQRVVVSRPNTIFWFIPHGHTTQAAPLEAVSDVSCGDGRETGLFSSVVIYGVLLLSVIAVLFLITSGAKF